MIYRVSKIALKVRLAESSLEFSDAARQKQAVLEIPTPDGKMTRFRIGESPILSPKDPMYKVWKTSQG